MTRITNEVVADPIRTWPVYKKLMAGGFKGCKSKLEGLSRDQAAYYMYEDSNRTLLPRFK